MSACALRSHGNTLTETREAHQTPEAQASSAGCPVSCSGSITVDRDKGTSCLCRKLGEGYLGLPSLQFCNILRICQYLGGKGGISFLGKGGQDPDGTTLPAPMPCHCQNGMLGPNTGVTQFFNSHFCPWAMTQVILGWASSTV